MSSKYSVIVSASIAAKALGGFSSPAIAGVQYNLEAGSKYEQERRTKLEQAKMYANMRRVREAWRFAEEHGAVLWCSGDSIGGRYVVPEPDAPNGAIVRKVEDWGMASMCYDPHWYGYDMNQVSYAEYTSATSGSVLSAEKLPDGDFRLEYHPPKDDPEYKGSYYSSWLDATKSKGARKRRPAVL